MRRALSLTIATALALSFAGGAAAQTVTFTDVQGTRYADAFSSLAGLGVVNGYSDGTARPYAVISRVEALKIIVELEPELRARAQWFKANMPPIALFPDVDQGAWYAPYVEAAFEAGIVTGYPDHLFRPAAGVGFI